MKQPRLNMRFIFRYEHPSGKNGFWHVKFHEGSARTGTKKIVAQLTFADLQLGGKAKALKAAKQWRDETAITLGKVEQRHSQFEKYRRRARNSTGVVGVYEYEGVSKGRYRHHYYVEWRETGPDGKRRPKVKLFPIGTTNKETQFRMAVRWRKKMEKLHYKGAQKNR